MTVGRTALMVVAATLATAAVALSAAVLPVLRSGHLYAVRTGGDGDGLRGAVLLWLVACVVTAAALGLSLLSTGGPGGSRRLRATRLVVLSAPLVAAHAGVWVGVLPDDCWRSCAPFPR